MGMEMVLSKKMSVKMSRTTEVETGIATVVATEKDRWEKDRGQNGGGVVGDHWGPLGTKGDHGGPWGTAGTTGDHRGR